jgi:RHS repeat-associated protein
MGSLLAHGQDASGQYYRRNRYYDAGTGRFTQEDPIGLAGGINLYGYANGDPIKYGDPYGLSADSIKLQIVWTGPGSYHTSLQIKPEQGSPWASDPRFASGSLTLGAGPSRGPGALGAISTLGGYESLQSDYNRPGDVGAQTATFTLDPGAQGEATAIGRLLEADAAYGDDLRYEFTPGKGVFSRFLGAGYNSNSYTAGLLSAAGMSAGGCSGSRCHGYYVPGFQIPVPASSFR